MAAQSDTRGTRASVDDRRRLRSVLALLLAACTASVQAAAAERVVFDFETADLQGWRIVEGEFVKFLSGRSAEHHNGRPFNKQGKHFLTTLDDVRPNGRFLGIAESPVFVLTEPGMSLKVAGGRHANTYVALCTMDGKEVLKAHGDNAQPFKQVRWSAPQLVGRRVFLRVADGHPGSWGDIALDCFVAQGKIDPIATEKRFAERKPILPELRAMTPARKEQALHPPSPGSTSTLRAAIRDLMATFGDLYPDDKRFLRELRLVETRLNEGAAALEEFRALQRQALVANPLVSGQPILFVVRHQYKRDHHNTATLFQTGEIIQAGRDKLTNRPRADMANFQPCSWHQQLQRRYDTRKQVERSVRDGICAGRRTYD